VKVVVQLFATLAAHLPAGARGDSVNLEVPPGATIADVVRALKIPADLDCLRVLNGHDAALETPLSDGDVVTLCPPLVGGN
jgi:molybdopterin converting factor small subunit